MSGVEAAAIPDSSRHALPGKFGAIAITPSHPDFLKQIEVGVRNLVKLIAVDIGWITYSSCEGHQFTSKCQLLPRHVGVLPRNSFELHRQRYLLYATATRVNMIYTNNVRVTIRDDILVSEIGENKTVLDIIFIPTDNTFEYFSVLDDVTELFSFQLGQVLQG